MTFLDTCHELDELGGGRFRHIANLRPIAFRNAGSLQRIVNDFVDGDVNFPHIVSAAPMLVYTAPDGMRRLCPTRDPAVYFEIGAPFIKPGGQWQQVSLNPFVRTAHRLLSVNTNVDVSLWMGGHLCKLEFELKGGYVPPNSQVAFPIGLNGLTRSGSVLSAAGVPVMTLGKPVVYDAANPIDTRPIAFVFQTVAGQPYVIFTLPSLAGMSRPVVDPTLTLQPDGTAGLDTFIATGLAVEDINFGTEPNIAVGDENIIIIKYRTLIKFDLSTLPSDAAISAATLSLYSNTDNSSTARTFRVFRQKRAWVETQATWNSYSTGNGWSTAGGFHADDCEQTDIGARDFTATETQNEFKDFALTPTTKAALDLGNGWLVKADTEADDNYYFNSSDHATAATRPKLVVEYTLATPAHRPFPILR